MFDSHAALRLQDGGRTFREDQEVLNVRSPKTRLHYYLAEFQIFLLYRFILCFFMLFKPQVTKAYYKSCIDLKLSPGGGGVLPYMGYIGMCGPKGYGFSPVLVINRVLIIAILPPLWS